MAGIVIKYKNNKECMYLRMLLAVQVTTAIDSCYITDLIAIYR